MAVSESASQAIRDGGRDTIRTLNPGLGTDLALGLAVESTSQRTTTVGEKPGGLEPARLLEGAFHVI